MLLLMFQWLLWKLLLLMFQRNVDLNVNCNININLDINFDVNRFVKRDFNLNLRLNRNVNLCVNLNLNLNACSKTTRVIIDLRISRLKQHNVPLLGMQRPCGVEASVCN